jgi:hypothetical protein
MKTIKKLLLALTLTLTITSCSTPDQETATQNTQTHILKVEGLPGHEPGVLLNGIQISSAGTNTIYSNAKSGDVVTAHTLCLYSQTGGIYYPIRIYIDGNLVKSQTCDIQYTIQ